MVKQIKLPFSQEKNGKSPHGGHDGEESDADSQEQRGILLGFLDLPLASAFAQLLLGFERGSWGSSGRMMVVFLRSTQRGAKQWVANPGFNEGEGGAVRVSSSHHHLEDQDVRQRRSRGVVAFH